MEALPPAPVVGLPPPPDDGGAASSFYLEPPPLAVLPGDDLTRFILRNDPPSSSSTSTSHANDADDDDDADRGGGRKKKKSRGGRGRTTGENDRGGDDVAVLPPKIGIGLVVVCENNGGRPSGGAASSSAPPPPPSVVRIRATVAGRLVYRPSSRTWYVASNPKRYHPTRSPPSSSSSLSAGGGIAATTSVGVGDRVIGMIEDQRASADYYRVNVFGSHPALLHVLSFEGASKRNRPTLEPGSLVYCRVVRGFGGGRMDSEVSCKVGGSGGGGGDGKLAYNCDNYDLDGDNDDGGAAGKDWMTNEGTYGPLVGGTSFRVPLGLARELLLPKSAVLDALDRSKVPFEIAVGVNGVVWTNSPEPSMTIVISNAIRNSEVMAEDLVRGMVKVMVKNAKKELDG